MPVYILGAPSDLDARAPAHLQRIPVPVITLATDCQHRSVKVRVLQKGPVVSTRDKSCLLKAVVQEEDPQQSSGSKDASINVILFGTLAKDFSQSVNQGDVVLMVGFSVCRSPTTELDGLHSCNLLLDGADACVYVSPAPPPLSRGKPTHITEPKYTYVALSELKARTVVNVYGVVTFFKQPFPTKGTDYCSTLKITDQSNAKVACTIFSERLEDHPVILRVGDIIRLHRVKTQLFNGSMTLMTSLGWSTVTFDGAVGSPLEPRASTRSFSFGESDRRAVEALRLWVSGQAPLVPEPALPLSAARPGTYFDLTCQLLAKAHVDSSCTLLKVWDGTRCSTPLLHVAVEPGALQGPDTCAKDRENLTADVLVYDNHVETARGLQPGSFLRIYNLHAVPQSAPGQPPDAAALLSFHLHGGTSYGRGLRALPPDSPDLLPLRRALEAHTDVAESDEALDGVQMEVWYTPPQSVINHAAADEPDGSGEDGEAEAKFPDKFQKRFQTVRTCEHTLREVSLAQVKSAAPPRVSHVRAQLKACQPTHLHQALKLYCPKCKTLREVPDEEQLARVFTEALQDGEPCSEHWALSSSLGGPGGGRTLTMHLASDMLLDNTHTQLLFIQGVTLEEMCVISQRHQNAVAVRSCGGRMSLLELSAPFLFCRDRRHYGCKRCSQSLLVDPVVTGVQGWSEQSVADALGVQLMQYVLLMRFELQDATGSLQAWLWDSAEKFFGVSAVGVSAEEEQQQQVQDVMDSLLPPGGGTDGPWLDLCLTAYTVEENGQDRVCYQIVNTESTAQTSGASKGLL